jgi:DNA-binding response OmpR family regulator
MAHFLVVEDFPPMATLLVTALRRQGHAVARAGSITNALNINESFDHAVLDVDLPDGDGVELATLLLSEHRVNSVVFFTASRDLNTLTQAARLGLVVDKAAGYDCLMSAVRQLVTNSGIASRVAVAGSPETLTIHAAGRSGTRRKIE